MNYCQDCQKHHYMMEICPYKPGLIRLWQFWYSGERNLMIYLAVIGSMMLAALIIMGIIVSLL
jgi:hypothetical protein